MAIKIHHGPNGSYKTSGAIWDDAVPAAKEGRLIITNVRGVSRARFESLFDDLPDTFDVEFISHETTEGMERIRTWFQWAPRNAFLIFDEAQVIFPSKWTDKYVERFNFPGGPEAALALDKPTDWLSAWTMHRHFNWDIILTMPNIKYLHTDIRNTSEAAYQHSNLMLLGKWMKKLVAKDYKEAMHSAQDNRAPTDGSNIVQLRKIDKRVFDLYDSTATGLHRDTMAGKNALLTPRVFILLFVVVAVVAYIFWRNDGNPFHNPLAIHANKTVDPPSKASVPTDSVKAVHVDSDGVPAKQVPQVPVLNSDPYGDFDIVIKGSLWSDSKGVLFVFQMSREQHAFTHTSRDMIAAGYEIYSRGSCAADLVFQGHKRTVTCLGSPTDSGGERRLGSEPRSVAVGRPSFTASQAPQTASIQQPGQHSGVVVNVVADTSRTARTLASTTAQ
jgi:zona occludens toxin